MAKSLCMDNIHPPILETTGQEPSFTNTYEIVNDNNYDIKNNYTQWSVHGTKFFPSGKTIKKLYSGYYTIGQTGNGEIYLEKNNVNLNELFFLPNDVHQTVFDEIRTFWERKEKYIEYGEVYRTNILIHSAPGTGKSSLINLLVSELITKKDGFVISLNCEDDIYHYRQIMKIIREIDPNRQIITIIEDIDNFISKSNRRSIETELLNILDGLLQFDNVVTIATTNYPEELSERYTNRPTRFGLVIEYPHPDADTRRFFMEKKIKPADLETINVDEWVKKTEGYTTDHLNSIIKMVFVNGLNEDNAFDRINKMIGKGGNIRNESKGKNNKNIGFSK